VKLVPTFTDKGCHVVSLTDPYDCNLGFLDRSRYFSIKQLLNCTHEAEWTPFQTHFFFSGSAGNRTRSSGSVAKNSDHYTTEAVYFLLHNIYKFSSYLTANTIHLRYVAKNSDHYTTEAVTFFYITYINSVRTSQQTQYIFVM
jgi:hypothetical protein